MSDFVPLGSGPMDIEEEAECEVDVQLVTVEGEQGVGGDVKGTSVHNEDNSILDSDKGELSDKQDQLVGERVRRAVAWTNLDEVLLGKSPGEVSPRRSTSQRGSVCYRPPVGFSSLCPWVGEVYLSREHLHKTIKTKSLS